MLVHASQTLGNTLVSPEPDIGENKVKMPSNGYESLYKRNGYWPQSWIGWIGAVPTTSEVS